MQIFFFNHSKAFWFQLPFSRADTLTLVEFYVHGITSALKGLSVCSLIAAIPFLKPG